MSTEIATITFSEAETWVINATFHNADDSPLDLTGVTDIEWGVALDYIEPRLLTALIGSGITVLSPANGTAIISLSPSAHAAIPAGEYVHECLVTLPSGIVTRQFFGKLTITSSMF